MKLEDQVTNLDLSKRLCELGVKQESLFYWGISEFERDKPELTLWKKQEDFDNWSDGDNNFGIWSYSTVETGSYKDTYSAFTVAELGELLPSFYHSYKTLELLIDERYYCEFKDEQGYVRKSSADTEANARAKMLIYLLENHLIKEKE